MTFYTENLKDILKPRFVVKHLDWLPKPTHKQSGTVDLKVWCPEALCREEAIHRLNEVHSKLMLCYDCKLYTNGKLQFAEHKKISPIDWKDKKSDFVEQFRCEDGLYRFETILNNEVKKIDLGFRITLPKLPEPFTPIYLITSNSDLAYKHNISIVNSPCLIDIEHQNNVQAHVINNSLDFHIFTHGAKIAQGFYTLAISQSSYLNESIIETKD